MGIILVERDEANREDVAIGDLIQQLVKTDRELQTLGHNQIDAVLDPQTLTSFLLQPAQVTLQTKEKRLEFLLEHLPQGIVLLDNEQHLLLANPLAESYLALLADIHPDGKVASLAGQSLGDLLARTAMGGWSELIPASAQARVFEAAVRRITPQAGESLFILVLRDVTGERDIERQLRRQERLTAIGQLAAGIAHDFNNVLASIVLHTHLINQAPRLPRQCRQRLNIINQQAERAADLVRQILDFSRQSVMTRRQIAFTPFLCDFKESLAEKLPSNYTIELRHDGNECYIEGDLSRLERALINLVANSLEAMPGGGKIALKLSYLVLEADDPPPISNMKPGQWICLSVSDTGPGIPNSALPHLFEPFFTTKPTGLGKGLGLAQTYGIIRQHRGHITVRNNPQEGAVFTIYLPCTLRAGSPPAPEETHQVDMPAGSLQPVTKKNILLVEDDEAVRTAVIEVLETWDTPYRVLPATDGQQALALFAKDRQEIDLVLSDMVMPEMSGLELYHLLAAQKPDLKMIVMTGYLMANEGKEIVEQGIMAWVQKPFRIHELMQIIETVLNNDSPEEAGNASQVA